jgi:hypothetical protein
MMSERIGNVIVIAPEPDSTCELCGKQDETRPYGPGFKRICFDCGMKDEAGTTRRMNHKLFGDPLSSEDMN